MVASPTCPGAARRTRPGPNRRSGSADDQAVTCQRRPRTICLGAGLSKVLLAQADKSADGIASSRSESVELVPAVGLGHHRYVGEHLLRGASQSLVIRKHLHPEQGLLGVGAQVVGSDAYGVGILRWRLLVLTEPEADQATAIVDQR